MAYYTRICSKMLRKALARPGGGHRGPDATAPGRSPALSTMSDCWPPRPRAGSPQGLVLNLGLQVVQDRLRRRMHVVDVDQMVHELPHKLVLGRSRNRNLAGCPCIGSANRWHRI